MVTHTGNYGMSNKELHCYLRVSTKSQEEEGNSIENQRHLGKKISKKLGMNYVEMNEGGLSSMSKSRIKLEEIIDGMRFGKLLWCPGDDYFVGLEC